MTRARTRLALAICLALVVEAVAEVSDREDFPADFSSSSRFR